jgi:hypothetical protein
MRMRLRYVQANRRERSRLLDEMEQVTELHRKSGDYLHSLQMMDVATGWSKRVAVLERSGLVMEAGFRRMLARLPFALLELHPDNGSEFLNNPLWRFFKDRLPGLHLSRSRPWQKNDNRFVEQKNQSLAPADLRAHHCHCRPPLG